MASSAAGTSPSSTYRCARGRAELASWRAAKAPGSSQGRAPSRADAAPATASATAHSATCARPGTRGSAPKSAIASPAGTIEVAVAIAGAFVALALALAWERPLCCIDDAAFAVVAKNLATGHGYVAS